MDAIQLTFDNYNQDWELIVPKEPAIPAMADKKPEPNTRLFVCVEGPNGHIWNQEIEWDHKNETSGAAIKRYKKMLGKKYRICGDWLI